MIGMIIEVCTIDNEPVETSKAYDALVRLIGVKEANRWTKEIVIIPGDDKTCLSKSS